MALVAILLAGGLASQAGKVVLTSDPAVLLPDGVESVLGYDAEPRRGLRLIA